MNLKSTVLFSLLIFISLNANAFTCRDYTGNEYNAGREVDIYIPINNTIVPGESILFDLSNFFSCRNDSSLSTTTDFMYLNSPGITTVLDPSVFSTTATINGVDYGRLPVTNPSSVHVYSFKDYSFKPVPIKMLIRFHQGQVKLRKSTQGMKLRKYPCDSTVYLKGGDMYITGL